MGKKNKNFFNSKRCKSKVKHRYKSCIKMWKKNLEKYKKKRYKLIHTGFPQC